MKKTIKVSDLVMDFLYKNGIKDIFVLSGGGNIHLIDSLGKSKLRYICNHHEQACATAAEGYARATGQVDACLVTTEPGGTNAITGVTGAWLDSIPMIVISGQVRTDLIGAGTILRVRQLGVQEINIVDMVKSITKYAVTVMDASEILYHLEKAIFLAKSGRPGPVWIDIPLDIQGRYVVKSSLKKFSPKEYTPPHQTSKILLKTLVAKTLEKLKMSERPVLLAGHGIRLTGAVKEFSELIDLLKIPILTTYVGYDIIPSSHPYFFGRPHALGQRAANFIVQNSDFFLSIGARLDILTVGFTYKAYARQAFKVMVDIDKYEIEKPILNIDLPINFDAKEFIEEMIRQVKEKSLKLSIDKWLDYGRRLNKKYPNIPDSSCKGRDIVNPYCFIDTIGKLLKKDELIVLSDGVGPLNCMYQGFDAKPGQRIILTLGWAPRGYGAPAAISASIAFPKKRIICFEGDGSLQLNIHELQVMKHHNLPIKLFVYSNDGYLSIRNSQVGLFGGKYVASNAQSGVSCPDYVKVGKAYGLKTIRINNHSEMVRKIHYVLRYPGSILCDINSVKDLMLTPKLTTKKLPDGRLISPPLEDMGPFLERQEFKENMLIPLWENKEN